MTHAQNKNASLSDTTEENKILTTILQLPEVNKISKEIDSISNGKSKIFVVIEKTPSKDEYYYMVRVAERKTSSTNSNSELTPTIYHFIVTPKTLKIKYYDTVNDKTIGLKEWRKKSKTIVSN